MAVGEWDQRQLCSDGGCVGVIGPDGTCKVCGRAAPNWGDERNRGLIQPPEDPADAEDEDDLDAADDEGDESEDDEDDDEYEDDEDEEDDEADDVVGDAPRAAPATVSPVEWGTRQLCPDGSCIGLIGDDGRCKVCGRVGVSVPPTRAADAAETAASAAGFTLVTTDAAVATTEDAVQTTASTITTDEAGPKDAEDPDPAEREPASKEPAS